MSQQPVRILLIEDEDAIGLAVQTLFELEGFVVDWARDGRSALSLVGPYRHDVIVTDLMMPVLDGFGFMREYLASPEKKAPIVAYSASSAYLALAQEHGATATLSKPFDIDRLLKLVAALARGERHPPSERAPLEWMREERRRIEAVLNLKIDAPRAGGSLDRVVDRTAIIFRVPICALSIVHEKRQRFHAVCGVEVRNESDLENPREQAFCNFVVAAHSALVVQDLLENPLFRENPIVHHRGLRFYAGVPLVTRFGDAVGTLCLMDHQPRAFGHADLKLLGMLGKRILAEFESHDLRLHPEEPRSNFQYLDLVDEETGVVGREGFLELLEIQTLRMVEGRKPIALLAAVVDEAELRAAIEAILAEFANAWIGRIGASRLAVMAPGLTQVEAEQRFRGLGLRVRALSSVQGERYLGHAGMALFNLEQPLGELGLRAERG